MTTTKVYSLFTVPLFTVHLFIIPLLAASLTATPAQATTFDFKPASADNDFIAFNRGNGRSTSDGRYVIDMESGAYYANNAGCTFADCPPGFITLDFSSSVFDIGVKALEGAPGFALELYNPSSAEFLYPNIYTSIGVDEILNVKEQHRLELTFAPYTSGWAYPVAEIEVAIDRDWEFADLFALDTPGDSSFITPLGYLGDAMLADINYNRDTVEITEPLTFSLFGIGLIGLSAIRRRPKQNV